MDCLNLQEMLEQKWPRFFFGTKAFLVLWLHTFLCCEVKKQILFVQKLGEMSPLYCSVVVAVVVVVVETLLDVALLDEATVKPHTACFAPSGGSVAHKEASMSPRGAGTWKKVVACVLTVQGKQDYTSVAEEAAESQNC